MLVYGTLSGEPMHFSSRNLMTPLTKIEGFFLTNWMDGKSLFKKMGIIRKVDKLIQQNILSSKIGPVYDIDDYKDALKAVNEAGNKGKVLLRLNEDV